MKRIEPCKSCPWRVGANAADIPGFRKCMARNLADSEVVMACHGSSEETPAPCAGWVVQVAQPAAWASGEGAIPMRLLLMRAEINNLHEYVKPEGVKLHKTARAMSKAIAESSGE